MSAFLCSVRHINALATFAKHHNLEVRLNNGRRVNARIHPQDIADILLAGNLASLRERYPEEKEYSQELTITWRMADSDDLIPGVVFKLAECLNYQACEVDDYESTDCAAVVRDIMKACVTQLPGYLTAPWSLDGDMPQPKPTPTPAAKAAPVQRDLLAILFPNGPVELDDTEEDTPAAAKPAPQDTPMTDPPAAKWAESAWPYPTPAAAQPKPTPAPAPKAPAKPSKPAKPAKPSKPAKPADDADEVF
ncbi:hypothetical protein [Paraburkholderia youngii]|uniref:hypothetical protein n=1 Tax=Paraburkholderia youngii TaxID=2782701 RepID=UPI001590A4A8|nr:hypothetical protein [Paraburkholderia youngii]